MEQLAFANRTGLLNTHGIAGSKIEARLTMVSGNEKILNNSPSSTTT